ncbi:hypothetical protein [Micromonospora carbonacea]|uniref:hypothetical protein n=1 Tax=Micromonospora carbonacea TaxID=47853 RepID=UPI00114CCEEF|nr:hypothetical protein [Micromonospora carbonacea]
MADLLVTDRDASLLGDDSTATFSPCRTWRYSLTRRWQPDTEASAPVVRARVDSVDPVAG